MKTSTWIRRFMPVHIFRVKSNLNLPGNVKFSGSLIYATEFNTAGNYSDGNYLIQRERYRNLVIPEAEATFIAPTSDRTIVNVRIEKSWANDQLSTYLFGNGYLQ